MNKNELEALRITTKAQTVEVVMSAIARVVIALFVFLSIVSVMTGLQEIVSAEPEAISA